MLEFKRKSGVFVGKLEGALSLVTDKKGFVL